MKEQKQEQKPQTRPLKKKKKGELGHNLNSRELPLLYHIGH